MRLGATATPFYLHPTTTVFVDDDAVFLNRLFSALSKRILCKAFVNQDEALAYVAQHQLKNKIIDNLLSEDDLEEQADVLLTQVNIRKLINIADNEHRFATVTTLVVDYDMPDMDGLSLCDDPILQQTKKIMLTGQADSGIAIKAFNDKKIDKFYTKEGDILSALMKELSDLRKDVFLNLTDAIINEGMYERYPSMRCLKDKVFAKFFANICEKSNIVEYYLTDTEGSFILFDKNAKPSYLSVKTDADMDYYHEIAVDTGNVGADILDALKNRRKVPYFITEENYATPADQWGPYLHTATCLEGEDDSRYYLAHIENNPLYLDKHKPAIFPFSKYLRQFNAS